MNATLRKALGRLAAVLLNVGVLVFLAGLLLPRPGGGSPMLVAGVVLCAAGLGVGAAWMFASRAMRP